MSTVIEFVEKFKKQKIMNTKTDNTIVGSFIKKELEVREYVPFVEKQSIAQIVLESCAHLRDGAISIDSIKKYIIFTITTLSVYTNLEFAGDETDLDAYDALCSCHTGEGSLLDAILKTFEKEYTRCNDILNMMTADLMAENNVEKQIGKFLSNLSQKISILGDTLKDKAENLDLDLSQLNIDDISNILTKIK